MYGCAVGSLSGVCSLPLPCEYSGFNSIFQAWPQNQYFFLFYISGTPIGWVSILLFFKRSLFFHFLCRLFLFLPRSLAFTSIFSVPFIIPSILPPQMYSLFSYPSEERNNISDSFSWSFESPVCSEPFICVLLNVLWWLLTHRHEGMWNSPCPRVGARYLQAAGYYHRVTKCLPGLLLKSSNTRSKLMSLNFPVCCLEQ